MQIPENGGVVTFTITKTVESQLPISISISVISRGAREGTIIKSLRNSNLAIKAKKGSYSNSPCHPITVSHSGTDFILPLTQFTIAPEESKIEVNLTILDDGIAEADEQFSLSVTARFIGIAYVAKRIEPRITILDNEGK